jgi:type IV pilus assembly protein PilW
MCNSQSLVPLRHAHQKGLSIIELMVALVIALLVSLAATSSAISFVATQRQGVSTSGASISSATAMKTLRDEISAVGLGFFGDSAYLCSTLNLSVGAVVHSDGATFSPLQVTREAAGDSIDIVYASNVDSGANVRLAAASAGDTALLASYLPVVAGAAVLLTPSPGSPLGAAPCQLRTVTAFVPFAPGTPMELTFGPAGTHNAAAFTTAPGVDADGRVTLIGDLRWSRYRLSGSDLVLERPLEDASATIARDVVSLRIQYGVAAAAAGSSTIEEWVDPEGAFASLDGNTLPRVRAIRIGMIVKSAQREKADASGQCTATATMPTLFGRAPEGLSPTDWNCFRYRTTTAVVPLRNVVIGLR